jgi:hypothetical protein
MPTRSNIFTLRKSNVSGKIPIVSQLLVGELAVNTQDGFLFTAIANSGGTATVGVRQIGWDRLSTISGGTVIGNTTVIGSFSATTYLGLPVDPDNYVTGGTYSNGTLTLNRQNGSVSISGFSTGGTNNVDTYVTGLTVSNSVLTLSQNNGQSGLTATIGLTTKVGYLSGGTFAGNPKTATVTFTSNFSNSNYAIFLTGGANRTYTYSSQSVSGFTISANSNPAFTENVYWQAISYGETL